MRSRKILTKRFRVGKTNSLISVGLGRKGPYAYTGIKTKKGISIGASVGTKGRQIYGSWNKKNKQIRIRYNLETNNLKVGLRKKWQK